MSVETTERTVVRVMPVLDYGGVEQCTISLAESIDRTPFDLRVCTFWKAGSAAERIREMGVPVDVLGVDPEIPNPAATLALAGYLGRRSPEVVHAAIAEANYHAAIAGRLAGTPVVIGEEVGTPSRSAGGRMVFGLVHRLLDRTIGVSEATCEYVAREEFAPRERVELVYNPVDPAYFDVEPSGSGESGRFRVVSVGRLTPEKNFGGFLEAFERVAARHAHVDLQIAGDGPLAEDLEAKIARRGLGDRVELLGYCDDVRAILAGADLFVLPSVSEGYGIALVEAMAAGLPVIGSTAGGIPEVLGPFADGWAISADDREGWAEAIERVMAMAPAERAALGERMRERARREFSAKRYISRVTDLYARLVDGA